MATQLFEYQKEGVAFLAARRKAYLADAMGLGKSIQAIRAADKIDVKGIVVVCPSSVRYNWSVEFAEHSLVDRPVSVMYSGKDDPEPNGVTIVSYDLLTKAAVRKKFDDFARIMLICDEAHMLKTAKAQRTRAIFGNLNRGTPGLASRADRLWLLSGTPAPNDPSELWAPLKALGAYPRGYWDFVNRYTKGYDSRFGYKVTGGKNLSELRASMRDVLLRRRKDQVLKDLPPISHSYLNVEPGEVDMDAFFPRFMYGSQEMVMKDLRTQGQQVYAVINACRLPAERLQALQALNDRNTSILRRFVGLAKVDSVAEIVKDELRADQKRKLVLFCIHRDVIEELKHKLKDFKPARIYGGTPAAKRQKAIQKFHDSPSCRVFIGQTAAAGTGINLQGAASDVLVVEPDWTPANNAQAVMRVHRIGQTSPVSVRWVRCKGATVDEIVVKTLKQKTETLTQLFDNDEDESDA